MYVPKCSAPPRDPLSILNGLTPTSMNEAKYLYNQYRLVLDEEVQRNNLLEYRTFQEPLIW